MDVHLKQNFSNYDKETNGYGKNDGKNLLESSIYGLIICVHFTWNVKI